MKEKMTMDDFTTEQAAAYFMQIWGIDTVASPSFMREFVDFIKQRENGAVKAMHERRKRESKRAD